MNCLDLHVPTSYTSIHIYVPFFLLSMHRRLHAPSTRVSRTMNFIQWIRSQTYTFQFWCLCAGVYVLITGLYLVAIKCLRMPPFHTPASIWSHLDCDHLTTAFDQLGTPMTSHTFGFKCKEIATLQFPVCQQNAPDDRFGTWKQYNTTVSMNRPYPYLLFPMTDLLIHGDSHQHLDHASLVMTDIPWKTIQPEESKEYHICYLGDWESLVHVLETDYTMTNKHWSRELHANAIQLHAESTRGTQVTFIFHYVMETDLVNLDVLLSPFMIESAVLLLLYVMLERFALWRWGQDMLWRRQQLKLFKDEGYPMSEMQNLL